MPEEKNLMQTQISPDTGLNIEPIETNFLEGLDLTPVESTELGNLPFDVTERFAGSLGVGEYSRDVDLNLYDVINRPQDLNYQRAEMQTGWELAGKAVAQGLTEATLGALEGVGYALDFEELFDADKQAEEGFDNWFSAGVRDLKESIQDDFHIYQSADALDGNLGEKMADGTWWASQGKTMGTTLSLLMPAMGVGAGIAALGKVAKLSRLGKIASPLAAASFSRKAESAMEANQKFQEGYNYHYNDPKLIAEIAAPRKKEIDQIAAELDKLNKTLYNPSQENYQLLEAERRDKITHLEYMRGQITTELEGQLDQAAKSKAGNEAANVFKANAMMLPLDIMQYALLLKPFSGIKKVADAAKKTKIGRGAQALAIQPGSEALEEGYQFVASKEASATVREDTEFFGEGLDKRLAKYAKDPHLHEAMFLGGAMGFLFDVIGTGAQKMKERNNKLSNETQKENITEASYRESINNTGIEKIVDDYKDGKSDQSIEMWKAFKQHAEEDKEIDDTERTRLINIMDDNIDIINSVKKDDEILKTDNNYTDENLRLEYVKTKAQDKIYSDEMSKLDEMVQNGLNESGLKAEENSFVHDRIKKQQLKAARNEVLKERKDLSEIERQEINTYVEDNISKLSGKMEESTRSMKEADPKFKASKITPRNVEHIHKYIKEAAKAEIYRETVIKPKLNAFANISKEEVEIKTKELKGKEDTRIENIIKDRLKTADTVEKIESIKTGAQAKYPDVFSKLERDINGKLANVKNKAKVVVLKEKEAKVNKQKEVKAEVQAKVKPVEKVVASKGAYKGQTGEVVDVSPKGKKLVKFDDGKQVYFEKNDISSVAKIPEQEIPTELETPGFEGLPDFNNATEYETEIGRSDQFDAAIPPDTGEDPFAQVDDFAARLPDVDIRAGEALTKKEQEVLDINKTPAPKKGDNLTVREREAATTESVIKREQAITKSENISLVAKAKKHVYIGGIVKDELDENNKVILEENYDASMADPSKYVPGSIVGLRVNEDNFKHVKGKITAENIPISVYDVKDITELGAPYISIRDLTSKLNVGMNKDAKAKTLKLRKKLYDLYKAGETPVIYSTVTSKDGGWTNRSDVFKSIKDNLYINDDLKYGPIQIISTNNDRKIILEDGTEAIVKTKLGPGDETRLDVLRAGIPHVVFDNANGEKVAIPLKFREIKHNPNFKEYIDNVFSLITSYAKETVEFEKGFDIHDEVGKYFHLRKSSQKEDRDVVNQAGGMNNIFTLSKLENIISISLPGKKGFKSFSIERLKEGGGVKIFEYEGRQTKEISEDVLYAQFNSRLVNMYPNVLDKYGQDPASFDRYIRNEDGMLVKSDKQHYFDFLSEMDVVKTKIHPVLSKDGRPFYVTQPNIEISDNLMTTEEYNTIKQEPAQIKEDVYIESIETETPIKITETVVEPEMDLFGDVDDDADFDLEEEESADLKAPSPNAIDYNNATLSSFRYMDSIEDENKILSSALVMLLKYFDIKRETNPSKEENVADAIKEVFNNITARQPVFEKYSKPGINTEEARANKVYSNYKRNAIVAKYLKTVGDNVNESTNEDGSINFIGYKKLLKYIYSSLKYNSIHEMDEDIADEGNNERTRNIEGLNYKTDPEKSVSAQVKRMLSNIPKLNSKGKKMPNKIGLTIYEDYGRVFNYLLDMLSDIAPERIYERLEEIAPNNHMANGVLKKLDEVRINNPEMYNKFISVMKKQKVNFLSLLLDKKDNKTISKIMETNRSNATSIIFDKWASNYRTNGYKSGLLIEKADDIVIDKKVAKKLFNEFDNAIKDLSTTEKLATAFNKVGIDIKTEALDLLKSDHANAANKMHFKSQFGNTGRKKKFSSFISAEFGHIFSDIIKGKNIYESQTGRIKKLANYQKNFDPDASSASFRNAAGDVLYGFANPHHLSNVIEYLKSDSNFRAEFFEDEFSSNSTWLKDLESINLSYFDASKNAKKGSMAKEYQTQNDVEKEITKINLYLNNNHATDSYFFTPSPSDKTTFALIKAKRMDINTKAYQDGRLDLSDNIVDDLYKLLVEPEINRINKTVRDLNNARENNNLNDLIKNYHHYGDNVGAGGYFFMIPELNTLLTKDADGSIIGSEENIDLAKEEIRAFLEKEIKSKLKYWGDNNIVKNLDTDSRGIRDSQEQLAAEFAVNSAVSYANQFMLFTGDPAQFVKINSNPNKPNYFDGNPKNWKALINTTIPNMFKRIAKDIAPGLEGFWGDKIDDRKYKIAFIDEPIKDSALMEKAYKGIELADAQEWTTLEEHVKVLYAYSKIDTVQRDRILANRDNLTSADIKTVMQPLKPVQVSADMNSGIGTMFNYYIKTSSFPLTPQVTKGFPQLDKMREFMETNNIDRLVPKTAVKIGFHKSTNLFKDGIFNDNHNFKASNVISLDRRGFRIQQDIPYDSMKNKILEGSQLRKLIHGDIDETFVFDFKYNNKKYTKGSDLKALNDKIHTQLFDKKFNTLLSSLDVDNDLIIQDMTNLKTMMVEEGIDRDYSVNDILALNTLKLDDGRTTFSLPPFFHPMSHKIESLFNSVIKNKVLKNKLPGKSYVQGSALGFEVATEDFLDLVGDNENGVILTKDYKGDLDYRVDKNGVTYGEIFVPYNFVKEVKNKDGKKEKIKLDIKDYLDKDGFLDTNKIDPSLLEMIGYRIPTQGFSSMIKLKVVGILPEIHGDLVIVPPAMVVQMGSDFDVDKLYIHKYDYSVEKDNKIIKNQPFGDIESMTESRLQNLLLDIYHSILENKKVGKMTREPLDNYIIRDLVDGPLARTKEFKSVISDDLHTDMIDTQSAGKIGISITSTASISHSLAQYSGIYIIPNNDRLLAVKFSDTEGNEKAFSDHERVIEIKEGDESIYNPIDNTANKNVSYGIHSLDGAFRLDKIFGFDGRRISAVITNIQTESVDNANNGRLYEMNLNKHTFNVAMLIARTGYNEDMIGYFLNQPAILEYVKRLGSMNNYTDTEFVKNKKDKLRIELLKSIGINESLKNINVSNVSLEAMDRELNSDNINTDLQRKVLKNFFIYEDIADGLRSVQSALNVDTQFLGASFSGVVNRKNNFKKQMNSAWIGNTYGLSRGTTAGAAYEYGVEKTVELFGSKNLLPYDSTSMNKIFTDITDITGSELFDSDIEEISIGIRSSLWNEVMKEVFPYIDVMSKRKELLFGDNTLAKRVVEAKEKLPKNTFIQSLNPIESYDTKDPSVIEHYSGKDAKAEYDFKKQQGWLDLLNSPEGSYAHQLGMDLFIYATTFGTERTARDFGRYLPYDFIAKAGLAAELRNVNFNEGVYTDKLNSSYIEQYFQHNPNKLPEISVDDIEETAMDNIVTPKSDFLMDEHPYAKRFNKTSKSTDVYKLVGNKYNKLDNLGYGTFITEYNISEITAETSMVTNTKGVSAIGSSKVYNEIIEEHETGENILIKNKFDEGMNKVLDTIVESGTMYSELAKYYLDNIDKIDTYSLERYNADNPIHRKRNEDRNVRGRIVRRGTGERIIAIAPEYINNTMRYQRTLMHELTHAFTLSLWNTPVEELNEQQVNAKENIEKLFTKVNDQVSEADKVRFDNAFTNIGEFVSEAFSNKHFQKYLNDINFEGGTVFTKFKNFITNLFSGIKKNSALDRVLNSTMNVIEIETNFNGVEETMNEPVMRMYQKFRNRPVFTPKGQAVGSNKVVLNENGISFYNEEYPKGSNKRHIANRFFRYKRFSGKTTEPYYPFTVDKNNWQLNKEYIDYINSHYDRGVVGVKADGSIVFRPDVDRANIKGSTQTWDHFEQVETMAEPVEIEAKETVKDRIIAEKSNLKALLENRVAKDVGTPEMETKISNLKMEIDKLKAEKAAETTPVRINELATNDANSIEGNLLTISANVDNVDNLSSDQISNNLKTLNDNLYSIEGWITVLDGIRRDTPSIRDGIKDISWRYSELLVQHNDLKKTLVAKYLNEATGTSKFTNENIVEQIKDIGWLRSQEGTIGDSGIELFEATDDVINDAKDKIAQLDNEAKAEMTEQINKLNEAGHDIKKVNDMFLQEDTNGNWTGNYIGEIKNSYYTTKRDEYAKAKRDNRWDLYDRWLENNSKSLNANDLHQVVNGNYGSSEAKGYNREELDHQKKLLQKYEDNKIYYREDMENTYDDAEAIEEAVAYWERANSPYQYADGELNSGSKYLINEKPMVNKWADPRFNAIKNDDVLYGFHKFIINRLNENNKTLGHFNSFEQSYMPEQRKTLLDRIGSEKNILKKFSILPADLKRSITNELDDINKEIVIAGRVVKSINVSMMGNKIPASLKDKNIINAVNEHTNNALNYKYKSKIEPITTAVSAIFEEFDEIRTIDENGREVPRTRFGRKQPIGKKLVNAKAQLEYTLDAYLRNEKKAIEGRIGKFKTKELVKDPITGEEKEETVERDITLSGLGDTLIGYTYLKAMSLPNIMTPSVNLMFGINANLIYASGGQDFTTANVMKSMGQMLGMTTRYLGAPVNKDLVNKTFAFMERFKLLGTINDSSYGQKRSFSEKLTILQEKAEHINQGSLMLAMLYTQKLKDKNGNEVSTFDAFNESNGALIWNVDKMGEQVEASADRVISEDKRSINMRNLGAYIDKVNAEVHGDYKSDKLAKKQIMGRLLFLFKTWMGKAVSHRFGEKRVDKDLMDINGKRGRTVKGRYKSFIKAESKDGVALLFKDTRKLLLKGFFTKKAFDELSDVDRVNMIRNMKEIRHILAIYGAVAMLELLHGDDDDESNFVWNLAINSLNKTQNDLSFFMSPSSASQIFDNILPIMTTLKDAERVISSITDLADGSVMYESGPWEGYSKIAISALKVVPPFTGGIKLINLGDKVISQK